MSLLNGRVHLAFKDAYARTALWLPCTWRLQLAALLTRIENNSCATIRGAKPEFAKSMEPFEAPFAQIVQPKATLCQASHET